MFIMFIVFSGHTDVLCCVMVLVLYHDGHVGSRGPSFSSTYIHIWYSVILGRLVCDPGLVWPLAVDHVLYVV